MTLPLLVSLVGLTACCLVISINFLTFTRTNRLTIKKRIDLVLIFARCILDIFVGIAVIIYITVIVLKTLDPNKVTSATTYFVVFSSLPTVFLWPTRLVLSICIAVWRIISLILPKVAESLNFKLVCSSVISISVLFGLADVFALLLACPLQFTAHIGCMSLGCMAGPCFVTYSTYNRTVLFSITFASAFVYAVLICFCETKESREKRIVDTDYWFLLSMFISCLFDCIPFAVAILGLKTDFGYNNFGPFIKTLNVAGACFDAVVVSKIFETHQFF
ncbi:unnamed protein product [Caenorhabditis sp. 36 PRJEB53466]|nr:unnamed protein product [Caenorhabditis sp. 36 PRJEB53466]